MDAQIGLALVHNQAIKITADSYRGVYRVLLDEPATNLTVLAPLEPRWPEGTSPRGGRKRVASPKRPRKKPRRPNVGALVWADRAVLVKLHAERHLHVVEITYRNTPATDTTRKDELVGTRLRAMSCFLDFSTFRGELLSRRGISSLVNRARAETGVSKALVYRLFSNLCRFGFSELSLHLDFDLCGARGVSRPCDPGGRRKPGAKTTRQRVALSEGVVLPPEQPGITSEWISLILAADSMIKPPKPLMEERIDRVYSTHFFKRFRQNPDGTLTAIALEPGTYPVRRQVRRVLEKEIPWLQRLRERTTAGHFEEAMRGSVGKSWQGVAGPGHTWAIDSTVGDIYLRSSLNPEWIIGRPVVYVLVDVWSTAVVGFYVCLRGPSLDMAKLAVFASLIDPALFTAMGGYAPITSLHPPPSLPARLLCDRGEYLSKGAKAAGMELELSESYTPPYRPHYRSNVEVLHRIEKDMQYFSIPGAIDARRKEYELRQFDPTLALLTIRAFAIKLHATFTLYNLTADRSARVDSHMKAADVYPSPAGLWSWGYDVGIGMRRVVPFSQLVTTLLPSGDAVIRRDGVFFGARQYDAEVVRAQQLTTRARHFGSSRLPCFYFPGSVAKIWTPNLTSTGQIELTLSDQATASAELTWDEVMDADAYYLSKNAERAHARTLNRLDALRATMQIVANAQAEATLSGRRSTPNMTQARAVENAAQHPIGSPAPPPNATETPPSDELDDVFGEAAREMLGPQ